MADAVMAVSSVWLVSLGLASLGLVPVGLVSLGLVPVGLVSLGLAKTPSVVDSCVIDSSFVGVCGGMRRAHVVLFPILRIPSVHLWMEPRAPLWGGRW